MSRPWTWDSYVALVKNYVAKEDEELLVQVQKVGRKMVTEDVPIEEIAEVHEDALRNLAEEFPNILPPDTVPLISPPSLN